MTIDQLSINTIRMLSIDQIEQANSGHPGLPMGAAPMAYTLWAKQLKHNPQNPDWYNRDRFILSAGHGSALLYSLLHLFGYGLTIDDLKEFRQWGSLTPGHPEVKHTVGVEATTGPLGQGIANAVGMAMAERHLAATYNRDGYDVIDHFTYAICGDGDLMEGIAQEAASLAGHLQLGKLIVMYDSNHISLDGDLSKSFSEDTSKRFEANGWQVLHVEDGNDIEAINQAIEQAKQESSKPTLIEVRTIIGYGSPGRAGTSEAHGKPLGTEEIAGVRRAYNWTEETPFYVPAEVSENFSAIRNELAKAEAQWNQMFESYEKEYPILANQIKQAFARELLTDWAEHLPTFEADEKGIATRAASGKALQVLAKEIPTLFGGSADLASSNNTTMKDDANFSPDDYAGRNIWFGVREHGMGGALNGMALHGGLHVFGATFLVFSDYLRPSIRLAALSQLPVTYVFTHDSVAVGEDGPTHEPVEHIPSLRLIPGLKVVRPADANETVAAWEYALKSQDHPVALILSRQNLPVLPGTVGKKAEIVKQGAYVVSPSQGEEKGVLIATGSEVGLAVKAQQKLAEKGVHVRVVSMPCRENFDHLTHAEKENIIPSHLTARVAIEAAHPMGWDKYVGEKGTVIGINHFGASAPGDLLLEKFGFNVENVVEQLEKLL
ncbi:transketolase [Shimazuella sp. AN120528]|uniref:transketolase n=1 Tax=Shimazuella soli TaxID=1892854 RepID=UPI001F0E81D7|nr:transketolase [Shimazuella soli]MCH5583631.1 transketolase [Shimazuella soli]